MKKILGIMVIAASLVACNNSGEGDKAADSTVVPATDSTTLNTPSTDSTTLNTPSTDTTVKSGSDTSAKK